MNESKISVRYAKALFQASEEAKVIPQVISDIDLIMSVYSIDEFRAVLDSPVVKTSDKKKVLDMLFTNKIAHLTHNFLLLVLENKRESYLPHIFRNFRTQYRKNQNILAADLIVSEPVKKGQTEKIRDLLKQAFKSEIELHEVIRPALLGGFILRVEDEQYDGSVSSGLKKIKKQLLESTIVK